MQPLASAGCLHILFCVLARATEIEHISLSLIANNVKPFSHIFTMENQIIQDLDQQILDLDRRERELEWELLDVFTDVYSVNEDNEDNEDNVDDEVNNEHQEQNQLAAVFKQAILAAQVAPTEACEFAGRYEDPNYVQDGAKKLRKIKKLVRQSNVEHVLENPRYLAELQRIQRTYPDHGGRPMLNELVAVYIILGGD
jgi:septal ring factor EnvC (AmiA/AmiB activator)